MKNLISKILTGETDTREYVTVTITDNIEEGVYLKINKQIADVSQIQWVLSLDPLVFGIWITDKKIINELYEKKRCTLIFESATAARKVAVAELNLAHIIEEETGILFLLELKHCRLYHFNHFMTRLLFTAYYKKPTLPFKRFKSFVTTYSYPRKVRIISFRSADHYNIFPMDLVGEIKSANKMAFGLRHTNRTLSKIIEAKKIVASEIPFIQKDVIYKLGRHPDSRAPPPPDELPFKIFESKTYRFYVPEWAESYKEIQITKTINLGSHMLLGEK